MACHQHTQQGHQNLLRDFKHNVVMVLQPHNSKLTIELLQDLRYDLRLEPTQQQAHNRTPAGFTNTNVVMVLQPHNSKLTIELLQDLQQTFSQQIN
jgi:hypothetical protein